MRTALLLTSTMFLAACGGAGPETAGSTAPPTVPGGSGGTGGGSTHSFVDPTETKTYTAIGAGQHYQYSMKSTGNGAPGFQGSQLYDANATTARNSGISVTYDPRSAEFTLVYSDGDATISNSTKFQDPLHRTDFGGTMEPQYGVDNFGTAAVPLPGMRYLEAGSANNGSPPARAAQQLDFYLAANQTSGNSDIMSFFYQKPGTDTKYVTFAGFVANRYTASFDAATGIKTTGHTLERGAFAFGELTSSGAIPTSGSGTYTGSMLASMIFNNTMDSGGSDSSFFQWITGTAVTKVDFAKLSFSLDLNGRVGAPQLDASADQSYSIATGAIFTAAGTGTIDYARFGGFNGRFTAAQFANPGSTTVVLDQPYLSGSSIDGAFFGPQAQEVGGSFRIVGGVPDERVDITGTFVGKK